MEWRYIEPLDEAKRQFSRLQAQGRLKYVLESIQRAENPSQVERILHNMIADFFRSRNVPSDH